jgi:hypothetical protein
MHDSVDNMGLRLLREHQTLVTAKVLPEGIVGARRVLI